MPRLVNVRFLPLLPLATLLFSAQAFAQFEVAPDHFDSSVKNEAAHPTPAKSIARTALPAAAATKAASTTQAATTRHKRSTGRPTSPAVRQSEPRVSAGVNRTAARLQENAP
jgi:hypothetical protein